jgi:hypothetical protein
MRFSEAIILGDMLKRPNSVCFLQKHWDGWIGCACGGALLAMGLGEVFLEERKHTGMGLLDCPTIKAALPWLTQPIVDEITRLYHEVVQGRIGIEVVAAYVRTMEPREPETEQIESGSVVYA